MSKGNIPETIEELEKFNFRELKNEVQKKIGKIKSERDRRRERDIIQERLGDIIDGLRVSIENDINSEEGVITSKTLNYIFRFAAFLVKYRDLKTNQIRKFYDYIRKIKYQLDIELDKDKRDENVKGEILKARYLLAYATGRNSRTLRDFFDVFDPVMEKVDNYKRFLVFFDAVQAILAYHKFFGGREN